MSNLECKASFRVAGEALEPHLVSDLLELIPTHSHRKGDPNCTRSGRHLSDYSKGIWVLESNAGAGESVEAHVQSLTKQLVCKSDELNQLKRRGFRLDIFVGVFASNDMFGFSISPAVLSEVANLGFSIDFDIYAK